jgi:hypothetical protein
MKQNKRGESSMKCLRIRFSTARNLDFSELGIPLEIFRKKRALDYGDQNLHFNRPTLTMLKISNAHSLIESPDSNKHF